MSNSFLPPALRAAATEVSTLLKARNETISVAETVSRLSLTHVGEVGSLRQLD